MADDVNREVWSPAQQGSDDRAGVGQEAEDVRDLPIAPGLAIGIESPAVAKVGLGEGDRVMMIMKQREVGRGMSNVKVGRSVGGLGPVDHSGDLVPFPQHVTWMKVVVQQAHRGGGWVVSIDLDCPLPELLIMAPRGDLKINWTDESIGVKSMIIFEWRTMDDQQRASEIVDRRAVDRIEPYLTGQEGRQVGGPTGGNAFGIGGDQLWCGEGRVHDQLAAQSLGADVPPPSCTPDLRIGVAQDPGAGVCQPHHKIGLGPTADHRLDRQHSLSTLLLGPGPRALRNHRSRIGPVATLSLGLDHERVS